jgi:hypothetical protein
MSTVRPETKDRRGFTVCIAHRNGFSTHYEQMSENLGAIRNTCMYERLHFGLPVRKKPGKFRCVAGAHPWTVKLGVLEVMSADEGNEIYDLPVRYRIRDDILGRCKTNWMRWIKSPTPFFPRY